MSNPGFKDHFSRQSKDYAAARPSYPAELFEWISGLTAQHDRVWDCATGSGQAAVSLANHYRHVVASDASAAQIRNRVTHERIDYLVALAESTPLRSASCDLVTVAQAVHWFDFERFYAEVRRLLQARGVLVLWTYANFQIGTVIDAVIGRFYEDVVGSYWPPERHYVEDAYRTIPFPFEEISAPQFELELHWNLEQIMRYLASWSAVQRYKEAVGQDPLPAVRRELEQVWGEAGSKRPIRWPFYVRAGRI